MGKMRAYSKSVIAENMKATACRRSSSAVRRALKKAVRNDVFDDRCPWCGNYTWCDCPSLGEYDLDDWDDIVSNDDRWWPLRCNCIGCRLFDVYHDRPRMPRTPGITHRLADKLKRAA
jgi:hypothetical protein